MLRKFYDANADAGGATAKFKMGESFDAQDLGIAEEKQQEEKKEDVVEAKEEIKQEEKTPDKPEDKIEQIEEKKETPSFDWKEAVKNPEHRKTVYELLQIDEDALNLSNELKSDDFVKKLVTYRKEHGNLTPFIDAATRDWDKATPEQLIMDDLKKQYSYLSPEKADKLAKADFSQRFSYKEDPNLDETENQEMAELTALKLESEGEKLRQTKKAEQQTFLDSVKPVDRTAAVEQEAKEKQEALKKEIEKFSAMYDADPATIKLNAEKKIVLGKEKPFNYSVNPESIKAQTLDTNKFYGKFWSEKDGKEIFNIDLWNRVIAYSENPTAFEEALINHGMSQELKKIDTELENAKEKTDQKVTPIKKSLAKSVAEGKEFSFNGTGN